MATTGIRRATTLDRWSDHPWIDGFQTEALEPLDTMVVRTRNSRYELTILSPSTGEVLVRGGRFFPDFAKATISGSSLGGSCLKLRGVYVGFFLELAFDGQTLRTTRIQAVTRAPRPAVH
jgi:hypothetical protein